MLCNARSIKNKTGILHDLVKDQNPDLVCVTETWVREGEEVSLTQVTPLGYSVQHQSRTKGRGGGVAIMYREAYSPRTTPVPEIVGAECVGLVWDSLEGLAILLVYRSPSAPRECLPRLLEVVADWALRFPNLIVLGDFNVPVDVPSPGAEELVTTMASLGLSLLASGPTHCAGHTLDLIFWSGVEVVLTEVVPVPWSDHSVLRARLQTAAPPTLGHGLIYVRSRSRMDPMAFQNALRDYTPSNSLDGTVDDWNNRLSTAIDRIAPRRPLKPRKKPAPWYTLELRGMKRGLRRLERAWRATQSEASRLAHRTLMKAYERAVKRSKKEFYSAEIGSAQSRPAQLFSLIRQLTNPNEGKKVGELVPSCDIFATFFTDKIDKLRSDLPATIDTISELEALPRPSSGPILDHFSLLSQESVERILAASRPTTCPLDPCPSWLVKQCGSSLVTQLRDIINGSLEQGVFPTGLKDAVVRPMLKRSGLDPTDPSNYRPVSNLPFLGKVVERVVAEQLQAFINEADILDPFQSGFRPGHGTETALLAMTDDLRRQFDRGGSALLILLDLSAAFDVVDHDLLVHRLWEAGIQGTALSWLASFLLLRGQQIAVGDNRSQRLPLKCGVPQGALLSPLLFNIFMRPLGPLIRSFGLSCHQYADDTQLLLLMEGEPSSAPLALASCLEAVLNWLKGSRLKLNPAKTEVLWLGRGRGGENFQLPTLSGEVLLLNPSVRSLGVHLDPTLSMGIQVAHTARTAFIHLRRARQLAPYLSKSDLATVIHATVTSRLDYCNALYAGLPLNLIRKLKLVQHAAARLLERPKRGSHITPILRRLHWLPIEFRIKFKVMVLTFRALRGLGPTYLRDRLPLYTPGRDLRSADEIKLAIPSLRDARLAQTRTRAFSCVAPALWNALPREIRASPSLLAFRRACKTWLFERAFGQGGQ